MSQSKADLIYQLAFVTSLSPWNQNTVNGLRNKQDAWGSQEFISLGLGVISSRGQGQAQIFDPVQNWSKESLEIIRVISPELRG